MVLDHGRETAGTTPLDGDPDEILRMPLDFRTRRSCCSVAACGFFVACCCTVVARGGGGRSALRSRRCRGCGRSDAWAARGGSPCLRLALSYPALPVGGVRRLGVGWWGVLCVLLTEGALFAYLLFSYGYCAVQLDPSWSAGRPALSCGSPDPSRWC